MKVVPFTGAHLKELHLQPAQAWMAPLVDTPAYLQQLESCDAYTAISNGEVVAIAGLCVIWPGRAHLSALVSDRFGSTGEFVLLHREVDRRLADSPHRRIEATVEGEFKAGHRWMRMLGFKLETPQGMAGYMPDGGKSYLYARVK